VQLELRRRLLQHRQQRARRAHHHRRRRHVPRRECRSAAAEVLGLVGCRRRGASSSSPAGAGGVVWGRISGGVGACAFAAVRGARLAWSRRRSRIRCGGEAPGAPTQIYGISEGVFRNLPAALVAESDAKHCVFLLLGFVFVFFFSETYFSGRVRHWLLQVFFFNKGHCTNTLFAWLISHQLAVLFSQNKPANSTFLSEQTSTSHQSPAKRTG
jgi:hypothetical protein